MTDVEVGSEVVAKVTLHPGLSFSGATGVHPDLDRPIGLDRDVAISAGSVQVVSHLLRVDIGRFWSGGYVQAATRGLPSHVGTVEAPPDPQVRVLALTLTP